MNESFSYIFGEATEFYTFGSNDWLMGAERYNGPIRSMSNPNARYDPDTFEGTFWVTIVPPCDGSNDQCGVHTNSGVQNFWFYLVSEGGTGTNDNGDDYEVDGIGILDAEAIAYRNLVMYLGSNSDYQDARDGSIQAAVDLFGLCSPEVEAVMDAWYAVGVGDPFLNVTATVTSDYNGEDISCYGGSDGEATAVASDGVSPYSFSWSNGQNTNVATGLSAGTYTVTATDDAGCTATDDVTLTEPPPLDIEAGDNQTIFYWDILLACTTLTATGATGGVPPYTYSWSSGGTEAVEEVCLEDREDTITIVTYYVTLTDANGCQVTDSVDVCYVDINCGSGGSKKVSICHYPPDNPLNPQTLCVSLKSLEEHLLHGDDVAACDFVSPCTGDGPPPLQVFQEQASLVAEGLEDKPLLTAFPDPCSESTTVRFVVPEDAYVDVNMFDIQGRLIRTIYTGETLAREVMDVEVLRITLPAGLYILRLQSASLEESIHKRVMIR